MDKLYLGKKLAFRLAHEHISQYKRKFFLAGFFMILAALATSSLPYLLQPVFDEVFAASNPKMLFVICGAVFLSFAIKGVATYGEAVVMTSIGQKIISDIQKRLFSKLVSLELAFFHHHSSGDLLSRFTNDVGMMRAALTNTIIGVGKDAVTLIFLIGVMFYRDYSLALIAFFVFPTVVLPIAKLGRKMRKIAHRNQESVGDLTDHLSQVFQGIRIVKAYGAELYEINRTNSLIDKIFQLTCKISKVRSASHPVVEVLGGIAIIAVIGYGGWQVMHHNRTTGEFISFIGALLLSYEPLKRLSNLNASLQEGIAAAIRVFNIIDLPVHITESPTPVTLPKIIGKVELANVDFSYNNHKKTISNLSLTITPGQSVAFVGASGAGKSTLINLVARFYEVTDGAILIDDTDIRNLSVAQLRSSIALVSQEITLFNISVRDNIAYGKEDASFEQIVNVAKAAAAHEFITKLPNGYDTLIGEGGIRLSGGQRQRLAIARAMLKDAQILLLDEATSALDTESEKQVQSALDNLMKGRTTLTVAHRLSTVINADVIYVLDHGKIIESGTHTQLLQQGGQYSKLWLTQSNYHKTN